MDFKITSRAFGLIPNGFSLEANFTIDDSSSLYSRASSEIGLPPW